MPNGCAADALAAVNNDWSGAMEIWRDGMGRTWAYSTVAHNLNLLAEEGAIERKRETIPSGFRYLYRRVQR